MTKKYSFNDRFENVYEVINNEKNFIGSYYEYFIDVGMTDTEKIEQIEYCEAIKND